MPRSSEALRVQEGRLGQAVSVDSNALIEGPAPQQRFAATLSKNALVSLLRVGINAIVSLVLPAYLTHRLPVSTYGAWVLILQVGSYVSFLDFGIQTGVAKFVAEHLSRGDVKGASERASAGLLLMGIAAVIGCLIILAAVAFVPLLFHNMPHALFNDVRISLSLIGTSLAFGLVCSVFSAVFLGLQQYEIPVFLSICNRILFTAVVCAIVGFHGSLVAMGIAAACVNVSMGVLQIVAWQKKARQIHIQPWKVGRRILKEVFDYCSVLAIWSVSMLCISGLDLTIVGHYDFGETGYYSLATLPATFMIMIISAALSPLMPAASALSTQRTPQEMGAILCRTTRYSTVLMLLAGLPVIVFGYPILRLWVGPVYASHAVKYMQILIVATMVRNLLFPYATMIVATGRQRIATIACIAEAVVNLGGSVYLAHKIVAIGVAVGTFLGALVSVALHFAISMRYSSSTISISRLRFLLRGLVVPCAIAVPSVLSVLGSRDGRLSPALCVIWASLTLLIGWFVGLTLEERATLMDRMRLILLFRRA